MDNFLDDLLLDASQKYEADNHATITVPESLIVNKPSPSSSSGCFAQPVTEDDILRNIESAIPTSTRRSTAWGVRVWTTWVAHRKGLNADIPPSLELITNEELNHWLSRFVMEVRNQNGQPYIAVWNLCCIVTIHT